MFSVSNLWLCFTHSSKAKVTSQSLHLQYLQLPIKRHNSLFLPQYWDHCAHSHCWNLLLKYSHHLEEQEDSLNIFCNNIKRTTQILSFFLHTSRQESKSSNLFFLFFFPEGHSTSLTAPQTTKGFQPMENYYNGATERDQQVKSHLSSRLFPFSWLFETRQWQ